MCELPESETSLLFLDPRAGLAVSEKGEVSIEVGGKLSKVPGTAAFSPSARAPFVRQTRSRLQGLSRQGRCTQGQAEQVGLTVPLAGWPNTCMLAPGDCRTDPHPRMQQTETTAGPKRP